MKQAILKIKDTIRKQVAESREIRKQIHASTGMDRYWSWCSKRELGSDTRHWLLALACLRGRSYGSIEAKCREGNEPSPTLLLQNIQSVLPQEGPLAAEWTKERVKAWLKRPEPAKANVEAA